MLVLTPTVYPILPGQAQLVATLATIQDLAGNPLTGDRALTETRLVRHLGISRRVVERRAAMALSRMVSTGRGDR